MEYENKEVKLCEDGKYRWVYEMNMITNPTIFLTVFKVFFWIIVSMWFVFGLILYVFPGDWEGLWGMSKAALVGLGIMAVLTLLGVLVLAAIYGGKYVVLFEMDENEVKHIQLPRQFKKAQALGLLTALVGVASKRPTTAGAGLLSAARNSSTSEFRLVRSVKARRRLNVIKVNQLLNRNQVYVPDEDFDFVYDWIKSRCTNVKK